MEALKGLLDSDVPGCHEAFVQCVRGTEPEFASEALSDMLSWLDGGFRRRVASGPLPTALAESLKRPGAGDVEIVKFLAEKPSRDFLPGLRAVRDRAPEGSDTRAATHRAIRRCHAAKPGG